MGKEWLWWLGEFGLAAVVAVVSGFVTGDVPISILYGLFVGTVFFALRTHTRIASLHERQVNEMEDKIMNFPVILSHRGDVDPYIKQLVRSARDEALHLAKQAAEGEVTVKSRSLAMVGAELVNLARTGDKVFATNYGVGFDSPQGDMLRKMNFDLADKGVEITRVFIEGITAKPEDKKRIREEMERQKSHIHVRFMKETQLPPEARRNILMLYGRYVAYAAYVKVVGATRGQLYDEIKIDTRREELEKAKELAENIIRLSEEYK